MTQSKRACPNLCPRYQAAMDVLGKPWNGMILLALLEGPKRFNELSARVAPVADRMLSARLKELEASGIVSRSVLPDPPVRVEYALTDLGRAFGDVMHSIEAWGGKLLASRAPAGGKRGGQRRASHP